MEAVLPAQAAFLPFVIAVLLDGARHPLRFARVGYVPAPTGLWGFPRFTLPTLESESLWQLCSIYTKIQFLLNPGYF